MTREDRLAAFEAALKTRVIVLDGAMGTQLQTFKLEEEDFRGEEFANANQLLKGNNDILSLTQPDVVRKVHTQYFEAGADIAQTNTFSATRIAQADYALESRAAEIARAGAKLAREAADACGSADDPKWVAGSIGPTNKTLSISPDVNDPGFRDVTFDEIADAYAEQADAMAEYVDFFLVETIFDTLNAKAAIKALLDREARTGEDIPILISGTITDASGRTLSGQTTEAFWNSVRHAQPLAVGLNCALGAEGLRQYVAEMSRVADVWTLAYPNAGLPNAFGEYDETPSELSTHIQEWAGSGLVNIIGGCCGTTPAHIKAIVEAVKGVTPRTPPTRETVMRLSGLEPFEVS